MRFLIVDDGSRDHRSISARCTELGFDYLRLDTADREFSVGRCRNEGAKHATTPFIFMQDVDLVPWDGFYEALLQEIEIQELAKNQRRFLMVPYVFLTERGTAEFLADRTGLQKARMIQRALEGDTRFVEKISTGTSANVYDRRWFLSRGGNSPDFEGWGYEDLEFNCRMIRHLRKFPHPRDWTKEKYNFNTVVAYETWKAPYRLFGDMLWHKGIVLFHAWHPRSDLPEYYAPKARNATLFASKLAAFEKERVEPPALPDLSRGRTLLMRRNAFTCARDFAPLLGALVDLPETVLRNPVELDSLVREQGITRLVFHNPYASPEMLALYQKAKELDVPLFIAERGALPGSFFFDPSGFLGEGSSYQAHHWDHPLDPRQQFFTELYLAWLRRSESTLEAQPGRAPASKLRRSLGLPPKQKVLLVVMQRPTDSVTRFFCGSIGSYPAFVEMLQSVAQALPPEWSMVVKRHPLEDSDPSIPQAIWANEAHIHDLLSVADAVLTFNSGVGVLGLVWNLPVFVAGQAFYGDPRLAKTTPSAESFLEELSRLQSPNAEARLRFLHYLVFQFYSFGEFITKPVRMPDGSRMTATMDILCSVVRNLTDTEVKLADSEGHWVPWSAPLYERYRLAGAIRRRIRSKDHTWGVFPAAREEDVHALLEGYVAPPLSWRERFMRPIRKIYRFFFKKKKAPRKTLRR